MPGGVQLQLHVQPGATRPGIAGLHGDALKIRVAAPPAEGRANRELLDYLAELLGVAPARIALVKGESGRRKTVIVQGVDFETARELLGLEPAP
ncbi:MAG TPA: DUF167 domain-containing protein [Gemmatimonadales bacterium]|nr:DUF167 domain-containing protein [Gemmatimonadales bacterium]